MACAQPTPIAFGSRLTANTVAIGEVRFALGRGLELARPEHVLAAALKVSQLAVLLDGTAMALERGPKKTLPELEAEAQRLRKAMPPKARVRLEQLLGATPPPSLDAPELAAAVQRVANRAGLLVADDPGAALRAAQRLYLPRETSDLGKAAAASRPLRELLAWAVSARHLEARELLGIDKKKPR